MSNYRQDEDAFTDSSSPSPRTRPSRYRLGPSTSDDRIPTSNPPWQPSTPSFPPQHSADPRWDLNGRPLDRPRSRRPSDYGSLLPTNVHWDQANEYAETQQSQVNNHEHRSTPATISGIAGQIHSYYAPSPPHGAARILVPEGAVSVVQEVLSETQPVPAVPFTTTVQSPVTTIQAMPTQVPAASDNTHTVTLGQLKSIKERGSGGNNPPEQGLSFCRNNEGDLPIRRVERKASLRRSLSRAGRKVSQGLLDALRLGTEPAVVFRADTILFDWNMYLFYFNKKHAEMGEALDPFQDQIEDAFDAKYQELLGEGKFLIEEESESLAEGPVELPVQEVPLVPTEVAETWIALRKAEQAAVEVRALCTGSARRRLPASELEGSPPKPRTYPAGPPPSAPAPQFVEDRSGAESEADQQFSTPDPARRAQSFQAETRVTDKQIETPNPPANERQSRLPRPSSNGSGRSTSQQRQTSRRASNAQLVDESKFQTLSKARKDSAQSGLPTKPAVQYRAQSQDEETYPKVRNIKR